MTIIEDAFIWITLPIAIIVNLFARSNRGMQFAKLIPFRPRVLNWMWATWAGFWWLPCPICLRNFGAHERQEGIYRALFEGRRVCPLCTQKARELNRAKFIKKWSE